MNTKTIIAGLLAGVAAFLVGGLIYGSLLSGTFADLSGSATGVAKSNEEMMSGASMIYLALGNLTFGIFLAFVFSRWANISTLAGGAKGGAIIGAFTALSWDLVSLGTTNISTLPAVFLDVLVTTFMMAVAGAVAGWWLGRS